MSAMSTPAPGAPPARLELVVALSENGVIGRNNALPWHLRADLQHFRRTTWGHPMLMGRRTWDSIGRALPGRQSLVLTRNTAFAPSGARVLRSLAEARELARPVLMVIGGAEIFRQSLPAAAVLHLTEVHVTLEGDVFFPVFRREDFVEVWREEHGADADNDYAFSFVRLVRRAAE